MSFHETLERKAINAIRMVAEDATVPFATTIETLDRLKEYVDDYQQLLYQAKDEHEAQQRTR
jgi:hypothetical protein